MFKNLSYVSISFIYVNLIGYIFHFFVSRKLSPIGYGEFIVLYSFLLTVGNIANIFTNVTVKTIIDNKEFKIESLRYLRLFSIITGLIFTLLGIIFSPIIKDFLNISFLPYIWIVSLSWSVMFVVFVERGYLQANDLFGISALSSSLEHSIRLIITIFLLISGYYICGAILPSFLSLLIILLFLMYYNKNILGSIKKVSLKYIFKIAAYSSPAGFFIYLDDIFIKKTFSPEIAGYYASASILGKALIWFSITIFSVFFPKLIEYANDNKIFKKLCFKAILLIILIFIFAEFFILIFGKKIFILLFGIKFENGFFILPFYVISVLPLTISNLFIGINTAKEKYLWLIYLQLGLYLLGFIILKFDSVYLYLGYIFSLNLLFVLIYSYLTFLKKD